jgi:hypothetical protein
MAVEPSSPKESCFEKENLVSKEKMGFFIGLDFS